MPLSRPGVALIAAVACAAPLPALGQGAYPAKPIRVIIPFAPGSALDVTVRLMGEKFQASTGQPLVLDHKGGAGGIIGNEALAKSPPDGYTLGLTTINMLVINPHLYKDLPYDPLKLTHITQVTVSNHVLAVQSGVPAASLADFVAWVKKNPGKVSIATNGAGTTPHLLAVLLNQNTGTDVVPVHYKGAGEAMKDFLGGHVQAIFNSPLSIMAQVRAGRVRPLAIARAQRAEVLPEVPTFTELGYPNMTVDIWTGYIAPPGTPRPIVDRLYAEFSRIMKAPDFLERMNKDGYAIVGSTPAEMTQMVQRELKRWEAVVKASGWKVQ
ncbi:MAG: tripartite tricarboxylate transporter substrate binding protein [Burkholderiales bacterium]|nr:tripartite tricarboxylate transporter substrate binding protein [Burkholderiales bacterium]